MTAATNKVESFNGFSQWIGFGNRGVIADNDPVEQEKAMKFNALLTNAVIFHNALDIAEIVRQLLDEGWEIDPEDLAHISPYLTEHINRFGEYCHRTNSASSPSVRPRTRRRLHRRRAGRLIFGVPMAFAHCVASCGAVSLEPSRVSGCCRWVRHSTIRTVASSWSRPSWYSSTLRMRRRRVSGTGRPSALRRMMKSTNRSRPNSSALRCCVPR